MPWVLVKGILFRGPLHDGASDEVASALAADRMQVDGGTHGRPSTGAARAVTTNRGNGRDGAMKHNANLNLLKTLKITMLANVAMAYCVLSHTPSRCPVSHFRLRPHLFSAPAYRQEMTH
jgi:hypothetical protein